MKKRRLDQKQKLAVLKNADKIGVREAAKVAGVHYTTVYDTQPFTNGKNDSRQWARMISWLTVRIIPEGRSDPAG